MPAHVLRGIGPPFPKQQELIDFLFKPDPDHVKQVDLCCGRGYGKSVIAIDIACRALSRNKNAVGLFLEPDWKRVHRVFLKKWRKIVPPELYTINKNEQCITWINGAMLFYGPRNITGSSASSEDSQIGQDTSFIIDDEAALRCSEIMYTNNMATIREPSDVRFYLTVSTPRVGDYQRLVTAEEHILFRGVSRDNPYRPKNYVRDLMRNMSPDQARRELEGEFTTLRGKVWKNIELAKPWPEGNRDDIHTGFIKGSPWWLMSDLGSATGSFVVVQQRKAEYRGHRMFDGYVWVAVADFCPRDDASAARAFALLKKNFGTPVGVTAGADINTRATTDGTTVSYFAQQAFGNVPIYPCNESVYSKQVQFDNMDFLVCSAGGERRLTVAKNFVSLDPYSHRGVREMFETDEYEEMSKRNLREILPKSKTNIVQHTRDAMLMGFSQISPASWGFGRIPA